MLKKIIENLKKEREAIKALVQKREDYVDNRNERWQESAACEEYMDKTMEIEEQGDELESLIEELKELQD